MRNQNKAFSLIELLIVICAIALLIAVIVPEPNRALESQHDNSPTITVLPNGFIEFVKEGDYHAIQIEDIELCQEWNKDITRIYIRDKAFYISMPYEEFKNIINSHYEGYEDLEYQSDFD